MTLEAFHLTPVGYLIVQTSNQARLVNEYRRAFGPYYGVDRLPTAPEAVAGKQPHQPAMGDVHLSATLDEWRESRFENTAFIIDRDQALRLLSAFRTYGMQCELLYCQLAWREGEEERLKDYSPRECVAPAIARTLGFDVSWPTCTHSAILQPGVVPSSLPWRQKLNQYGLLDDYADAARLRTEYLAVYPYAPFDIYLLHTVEEAHPLSRL